VTELIRVVDATKHYMLEKASVPALAGVNLTIQAGERVCLMGPSGSGKSTLLNIIGCVDTLSSGRIVIAGQDASSLGDARLSELRNRTVGFVFQSFNLIPVLSVFENVEYPLLLQRCGRAERRARVEELLQRVGLQDFPRRGPERLSGGQRQRVAIARALVTRPQLLIADEPTAALDHDTGRTIMDLMVDLNRSAGCTLVFATHDPAVARYADRLVTMRDGAIVEDREAA